MSSLIKQLNPIISKYKDIRFSGSRVEYDYLLQMSKTLYLGNLSFFTTEEQIYELFSKVGHIEKIIMGLVSISLTPCGFSFIIYHNSFEAKRAVSYLHGSMLDGRLIRVDLDWGFQPGRQYGRGKRGGQVRDEKRLYFDVQRGGFG